MNIITTLDGSPTLYVPELDEHYHSVNGAFGESMHVFISAGFNHCVKDEIRVFEVGFGTGLNALLTFIESEKQNKRVIYQTIELYPVEKEIILELNFPSVKGFEKTFSKIHSSPWNEPVAIDDHFILHKIKADLTKQIPQGECDVIYFDAFAPEKQPEMWKAEIFIQLFKKLAPEGILTTYCAKGEFKRNLKAAGFTVEPLPGFSGKREMVRAVKV